MGVWYNSREMKGGDPMETRKLYYEDGDTREFTARVTGCREENGKFIITLDTTAFYPEGGGQAWDVGTLGESLVQEVREADGEVLHYCDGPLTVGAEVTGVIDWQRRFDLMQQHTGEHIISGIVYQRFGYHNVGFHMGADVVTFDFDGEISPEALQEIEQEANRAIWENLPVHCFVPSREELPQIFYRTKRELPWPVRIVEVPGVDSCACCGIHVKTTGQVGLIKLLSCVKFHQGVRIEMVSGQRAYNYVNQIFAQNRRISHLLSAKMPETAPAVEALQKGLQEEKYRSAGLEKRLFGAIAEGYRGISRPLHFEEGLSGSALRELAECIGKICGGAIVCTGTDENGYTVCITGEDARGVGTRAANALSGRGGGKEYAYQGLFRASRAQIEAYFGQ